MNKIELTENYFGFKDWICSTCGKIFSELTKVCPFCYKKENTEEIKQENFLDKTDILIKEDITPKEIQLKKETIKNQIINILAKFLCVEKEECKEESMIVEDLGADSLDCIEITMELEKAFNISIPDKDIYNKESSITIREIVDYIYNKKIRK